MQSQRIDLGDKLSIYELNSCIAERDVKWHVFNVGFFCSRRPMYNAFIVEMELWEID